ncbi:hypothetical protein AAF712_004960 [Marasmius tenuissimus]|uniref:Uncharacterized protein n=1 Tax=Marasmius tenuissimus TaxID=585030 RepID=A0ABR3A3X1_9AGAR
MTRDEKWNDEWLDQLDDGKKEREAATRYMVAHKSSIIRIGGIRLEDLENLDADGSHDENTSEDESEPQTERGSESATPPSFTFSFPVEEGHPIREHPSLGSWEDVVDPEPLGVVEVEAEMFKGVEEVPVLELVEGLQAFEHVGEIKTLEGAEGIKALVAAEELKTLAFLHAVNLLRLELLRAMEEAVHEDVLEAGQEATAACGAMYVLHRIPNAILSPV